MYNFYTYVYVSFLPSKKNISYKTLKCFSTQNILAPDKNNNFVGYTLADLSCPNIRI